MVRLQVSGRVLTPASLGHRASPSVHRWCARWAVHSFGVKFGQSLEMSENVGQLSAHRLHFFIVDTQCGETGNVFHVIDGQDFGVHEVWVGSCRFHLEILYMGDSREIVEMVAEW